MFYVRINKIKVINNREGILGLFNRAEMHIYSYVTAPSVPFPVEPGAAPTLQQLSLSDLLNLSGEAARKQFLLNATLAEANRFAQSVHLGINGVKDNRSLLFGEAGLAIYAGEQIPDALKCSLFRITNGHLEMFFLTLPKSRLFVH